jgi:hypothetical protein
MPYFGIGGQQQGIGGTPFGYTFAILFQSYLVAGQPYPSQLPPRSYGPTVTPWGASGEAKPSKEIDKRWQIVEAQQQIGKLADMITETEEKKRQAEINQTSQTIQNNLNALCARVDQIAAPNSSIAG